MSNCACDCVWCAAHDHRNSRFCYEWITRTWLLTVHIIERVCGCVRCYMRAYLSPSFLHECVDGWQIVPPVAGETPPAATRSNAADSPSLRAPGSGREGRGVRGASERQGIRERNARECLYVLTVTSIYRHQGKRLPHEFLIVDHGYCCGFIIMYACPYV